MAYQDFCLEKGVSKVAIFFFLNSSLGLNHCICIILFSTVVIVYQFVLNSRLLLFCLFFLYLLSESNKIISFVMTMKIWIIYMRVYRDNIIIMPLTWIKMAVLIQHQLLPKLRFVLGEINITKVNEVCINILCNSYF